MPARNDDCPFSSDSLVLKTSQDRNESRRPWNLGSIVSAVSPALVHNDQDAQQDGEEGSWPDHASPKGS
jgi:hypothetical protein